MKKLLCLALALVLAVSLCACGKKTEDTASTDTSPITMAISMGNGEAYYTSLAELVKRDLGIDVEFVYVVSCDTSDLIKLQAQNNDLPADIVFTSQKMDNAYLEGSCIDFVASSTVTSLFTQSVTDGCKTEDGKIYQLPVSSRLIGITYNETLLNEMGWDVPETFADMVELKSKCDEAGIKFAVADGAATGHGFNWLFHLMGAGWLSTTEGTSWFEGFQNGTRSIDEFKEKCEYFKKWTEAGLWGTWHNWDWGGSTEFMRTRALFWYGITNTVSSYEGPLYDEEGNATDVMLNDTYKSIPWISEDGSNNCYTVYDNCWVILNKNLENDSERLTKALEIVKYMATSDAIKLVTDTAKDMYVSVSTYEMDEGRLYYRYASQIKNGFVQPWYYNYFDTNTIVSVGEIVNEYISGDETAFGRIFECLDEYNQMALNAVSSTAAVFTETLSVEDTAKFVALCEAEALDLTLEANNIDARTDVAIVPYATSEAPSQPWKGASIATAKVYAGTLETGMAQSMIPASAQNVTGIYMTGAEIKAIVESGFDPSDRFIDSATGESKYDSSKYGPYPYVCLVRGGAELEDEKEYLVALCDRYITLSAYNAYVEAGKVITGLENACNLEKAVISYGTKHSPISAANLILN